MIRAEPRSDPTCIGRPVRAGKNVVDARGKRVAAFGDRDGVAKSDACPRERISVVCPRLSVYRTVRGHIEVASDQIDISQIPQRSAHLMAFGAAMRRLFNKLVAPRGAYQCFGIRYRGEAVSGALQMQRGDEERSLRTCDLNHMADGARPTGRRMFPLYDRPRFDGKP